MTLGCLIRTPPVASYVASVAECIPRSTDIKESFKQCYHRNARPMYWYSNIVYVILQRLKAERTNYENTDLQLFPKINDRPRSGRR